VLAARDGAQAFRVAATHARVASIGWHGSVELWDVTRLRGATIAGRPGGNVGGLAARDGRFVAMVSGEPGHVAVIAPAGIVELPGWLVDIANRVAIVADNGSVHAYDLDTGRQRHENPGPGVWPVAVSASGTRIAENVGGRITIRDVATWAPVTSFDTHLADISALAFGDGDRVATGGDDGAVVVWDARTGAATQLDSRGTHVSQLDFRGDRLFAWSWDQTLRAWDLTDHRSRGVVLSQVRDGVAVSPDGRTIATTLRAGFVELWDAGAGCLLDKLPTTGTPASVVFVDDTHVAVGGSAGLVEVFDLAAPARSTDEIARFATPLAE
jgi:WD40 repeat protein